MISGRVTHHHHDGVILTCASVPVPKDLENHTDNVAFLQDPLHAGVMLDTERSTTQQKAGLREEA